MSDKDLVKAVANKGEVVATAVEILERLKAGEVVYLNSEDVGAFMLECYRHGLTSGGIQLRYAHGRCRMKLTAERQQAKRGSNGE